MSERARQRVVIFNEDGTVRMVVSSRNPACVSLNIPPAAPTPLVLPDAPYREQQATGASFPTRSEMIADGHVQQFEAAT